MNRLSRYFLVGGTAALVDLLFFVLFHLWWGFHYLAVGVAGFVLATFVNYWLSVRWVFVSGIRFSRNAEVLSVYVVSLIGLGIHAATLVAVVELLDAPPLLGKLVAAATAFVWNFSVRNYYVFAARV